MNGNDHFHVCDLCYCGTGRTTIEQSQRGWRALARPSIVVSLFPLLECYGVMKTLYGGKRSCDCRDNEEQTTSGSRCLIRIRVAGPLCIRKLGQ